MYLMKQINKIESFLENGKIKQFPSRRTKQIEVLEWLGSKIDSQAHYSEKEINVILSEHIACRDFVFFRRELIDLNLLKRDVYGKVYFKNKDYVRPHTIGRQQES